MVAHVCEVAGLEGVNISAVPEADRRSCVSSKIYGEDIARKQEEETLRQYLSLLAWSVPFLSENVTFL